ncbi:hypothetical protein GOA89_14645 [Sinorhizobium meliloti]|nr:hypothetical protein [Sinorhizobium meliloti]MDW9847535.1 hypothetical protein [Sinorhizobium meliloti]MDX0144082.1 hypothetical protein [Sinorhizobium meliloti]MDX0150507.1 hypothetical protein [Sinorhizobium meliloti]MDX0169713.1 hypothetical protein [Sinorhizobium meliloti]
MPQVISFAALIVSSLATTVVGANLLYLGTLAVGYAGLAYGAALLQGLFVDKPTVPKPEDGNYNLKQSVPSVAIVLGRRKKGSDYAALEEKGGTAYHLLIAAGHRIQGFVKHFLHDEEVALDAEGGVLTPGHFNTDGHNFVHVKTRLGLKAETAYANLVTAFPGIFTNDHRGDGLASVLVSCETVNADDYLGVYPNQMPQHSSVIDGALVFDPRDPDHVAGDEDTYSFAQNLALLRAHHLTNPWGGKLNLADLYLPEWSHAADVCDESVMNRDGETEPRYHGGIWFRANNDQVQIGRLLDQAAELVVYERPDGLIGVHAGEFIEPDIRLTEDDIHRLTFKANRSEAATVLAVRGRFVDPASRYNTVDAAIWGDPYVGEDTQRTRTLDNQVIERHNHSQRLQKITMIRANAPRVSILATYQAAKNIGYRRFVRVHAPPQLNEAIVEVTSTPTFSFRNLTVEFSGIVVPEDLYDFDAAMEEGEPPTVPEVVVSSGVPVPTGFAVTINREVVSGGDEASFAVATWTHVSNSLLYEFEWQPTSGPNQTALSTTSKPGESTARSGYLADGIQHRFRLRAWSNGAKSDWTDYIYETPVSDPVAPVALASFALSGGSPQLGRATLSFSTANDTHLKRIALYRAPAGVPLDKNAHAKILIGAAPGTSFAYVDGDMTRSNLLTDGDFSVSPGPWTLETGWSISGGLANKVAGNNTLIRQPASIGAGKTARLAYTIASYSAGSCVSRLTNGTTHVEGPARSATGTFLETATVSVATSIFGIRGSASFVGSIDNVYLYEATSACAPQGSWDYYAIPLNGSGLEGPVIGPVTVTIV